MPKIDVNSGSYLSMRISVFDFKNFAIDRPIVFFLSTDMEQRPTTKVLLYLFILNFYLKQHKITSTTIESFLIVSLQNYKKKNVNIYVKRKLKGRSVQTRKGSLELLNRVVINGDMVGTDILSKLVNSLSVCVSLAFQIFEFIHPIKYQLCFFLVRGIKFGGQLNLKHPFSNECYFFSGVMCIDLSHYQNTQLLQHRNQTHQLPATAINLSVFLWCTYGHTMMWHFLIDF